MPGSSLKLIALLSPLLVKRKGANRSGVNERYLAILAPATADFDLKFIFSGSFLPAGAATPFGLPP